MTNTLYDYYSSQGKTLPSVQERAPLFEQYGLGSAGSYKGTADQNTSLLASLQSSKGSTVGMGGSTASVNAPPAVRIPGESIEDFTRRIDQGGTQPALAPGTGTANNGTGSASTVPSPIVATSESERIKERTKAIKEGLGLGEAPTLPELFGETEKQSLDLARQERTTIQNESANILNERMSLDEEFNKFKATAGEGVTEAGRLGAISEKDRVYQERYDALNRRELVLETKLNNRNSVISELMGLQKDSYANTVANYNSKFSQALQMYNIFDKESDDAKNNAKANLDVFSKSIQAQIESGGLTASQITGMQQAKIQELEVQAGLPLGSTMAVLQTLKPGEEKLYSGVDDYGNFVYITKNAKGEIGIKKATGAVPQYIKDVNGGGEGGGGGTHTVTSGDGKKKVKSMFTQGQLNKGAVNAHASYADFLKYDDDTKNFYINNAKAVNNYYKTIDDAVANKEDLNDLKQEINGSSLPQTIKSTLASYVDQKAPKKNSGGGFWAGVKNFFLPPLNIF